jgi:agmatine deiminase
MTMNMNTRRHFLQHTLGAGAALLVGSSLSACGGAANAADTGGEKGGAASDSGAASNGGAVPAPAAGWLMPDEGRAHKATWMAFSASDAVWGPDLRGPVQETLARVANAIVQFEPVNMLVNRDDLANAERQCDPRVKLVVQQVDDVWLRDSGPVFVTGPNGERAGVDFNFNGWGGKQAHANDSGVASFVCARAGVPRRSTKLVLEGGGIEVDGGGTAIITESCVLNPNRNPGLSKAACEAELKTLLGIRKVIWLPGIAGKDITDGHTDFYARFARPGVVVAGLDSDPASFDHAVTLRHLEILRGATDADNRPLRVVVLEAPTRTRPRFASADFAAGYVNFYVLNGAVLMPEFGDQKADAAAKASLAALFPGRAIVQLNIDPISAGGGGIHCVTQQEPLA